MDRRLLTPGMIAIHLLVVALSVVFVRLGVWQLDRLQERQHENAMGESRLQSGSVAADELLAGDLDPDTLTYRRVTATGDFDAGNEVLIRSQTYRGNPGFHVVTPLRTAGGGAIMVNRGWVPLDFDEVPVAEAPPPEGTVRVEGWLQSSRARPPLGREEPAGRQSILNRVDLARIGEQTPYSIYDMYLVAMGERTDFPLPVEPPDFNEGGPHLAYAIQWFGFAVIGVVGYLALLRRRLARPQEGEVETARSSTTS